MKKFTFLLVLLLLGTLVSIGQITALFVNDESEDEAHALLLYQLLKEDLPELAFFHAVDSARAPTTAEMDAYQLVIWYCGSDAKDLYFWLGMDMSNVDLINYLDGGGKLWLMGSGFLNDRYINTPLVFSSPFFVHDYLGIWQWFLETYTDDGGNGVPQLDEWDDNPVFTLTLETLNWKNPPEPWVDGLKTTDMAEGIYHLGPESYVFWDNMAAVYCSANDLDNVTFTFDPIYLDTEENIKTLFSDILNFYDNILSVGELSSERNLLSIYPNPSNTITNLQINMTGSVHVKLVDITGNVLREMEYQNNNTDGFVAEISVAEMPGGIYFVRVEGEQALITKSLVIAR